MGHAHDPHPTDGPPEHDPAHDVDGKKLALWLAGSAVGVFATVGILLVIFEQIIEHQRHKMVGLTPAVQVEDLRRTEEADLSGSSGGKSVDAAIDSYVKDRGGKPSGNR